MKTWIRFGLLSCVLVVFTGVTGCPSWQLTGIPCPACGMTRAWISLLNGQTEKAFAWHPLFWTAPWIVYLMYREFAGVDTAKRKIQNIQLICAVILLVGVYAERIWLHPHGPVQITLAHGWIEKVYSCFTDLRGI